MKRFQKQPRRGFTLVELMVVITIIAILAGLIMGAVFVAFSRVHKGVTQVELNNLAMGIEQYKSLHGEYPPSDWNQLQAHLDDIFPNRDHSEVIPKMDAAELLVFYLQGYSKAAEKPVTGAADRTPLFDLDPTRLVDMDGDGLKEYIPKHGTKVPYVYFSKPYPGQSYKGVEAVAGVAVPGPTEKPFQIIAAGLGSTYAESPLSNVKDNTANNNK